jgi:hypothetical protein
MSDLGSHDQSKSFFYFSAFFNALGASKQAVLPETPGKPKQEGSVETLFFVAKRPEL